MKLLVEYLFEYDETKDQSKIQHDFLKAVLPSIVAVRMSEFSYKGAGKPLTVEIDVDMSKNPSEIFPAFHKFIKNHRQFLTNIIRTTTVDGLVERIELVRSQFNTIKFPVPDNGDVRTLIFIAETAIFKLDTTEEEK